MLPDEVVTCWIYLIRVEKVMLDRDLAILFEVRVIRLREQVIRNIEKFPPHFKFQLTGFEAELLVSQNAIPSTQSLGKMKLQIWRSQFGTSKSDKMGLRYLPYAFVGK